MSTNDESREEPVQPPETSEGQARESSGVSVDFPIVAIGASAGGLDAFERFLKNMPHDAGIAFVLLQHLDPNHKSMMCDLLGKHTRMKVAQPENGEEIRPNQVYFIPPNATITMRNRVLHVSPPTERRGMRMPVDTFLHSLAEDQKERAIAIVLSGTGSDGSLGIKSIKEHAGLVMAQDPDDAQYEGMPQSAIQTGAVDIVAPVERMPERLLNYVRFAYYSKTRPSNLPEDQRQDGIGCIISLIKRRKQMDFGAYKPGTLTRRIERRMGLQNCEELERYERILEQSDDEMNELVRDLLIGVTSFFRDSKAYESLQKHTIQEICENVDSQEEIRVWVPGCSTGEEAYSLAILIYETLSDLQKEDCRVRIFSTDVDPQSIETARAGAYPDAIAADVSQERLNRFFVRETNQYRVKKFLREAITFSVHNVLNDPPFSRLMLVSCRNLMIYLNADVQRHLLNVFHFALNPDGFLFLGSAEGVSQSDLFRAVHKEWRIYQRQSGSPDGGYKLPARSQYQYRRGRPIELRRQPGISYRQIALQTMMLHYAPAAVLINGRFEVLQVLGPGSRWLKIPQGDPTNQLLEMVSPEVRNKVRAAVHSCKAQQKAVVLTVLVHPDDSDSNSGAEPRHEIELHVREVKIEETGESLYFILFQDIPRRRQKARKDGDGRYESDAVIRQLEDDLKTTRDDLESAIEQLETANEELKASNEEIMSMNEEYQSTNEELETSKEELQSLNEELNTVNTQLQEKVLELEQTSNDLGNFMNSANFAAVFLDPKLRVRRFTPTAVTLLDLQAGDQGRSISKIRTDVLDPDLEKDANNVLDDLAPSEVEVNSEDGRLFLRRIHPYRTEDNRIEGVVVSYVDVTHHRKVEQALIESEARHRAVGETVPFGSWTCDREGQCTFVTEPFLDMAGMTLEEVLKFGWLSKVPEDERDSLMKKWMHCVQTGLDWDHEYRFIDKEGNLRDVLTRGRPIRNDKGEIDFWAGFHLDITDRKQMERELREVNDNLEKRVSDRTREAMRQASQLRRLAGQLARLEQAERRRMADILHNHLQQLLVAAKWRMNGIKPSENQEGALEKYHETQDLLDQAVDETRNISQKLMPVALRHGGILDAIKWLIGWFRDNQNLEIELEVKSDINPISNHMAYFLFESVRELLFNTIKHSGSKQAFISIEQIDKAHLCIRIRDDGVGCNVHDIEKSASEGTSGYGLMSIRERLNLVQGSFKIRSEPGTGFCAEIHAPNEGFDDEIEDYSPASDCEPVKTDNRIKRNPDDIGILVVDDHRIVRDGLISLLQAERDFSVIGEAGDGEEAVDLAAKLRPDAILMDFNMPRMNGVEATKAIKADLPDTVVIGLSIDPSEEAKDKFCEAGAAAYIPKDGLTQELVNVIRKHAIQHKDNESRDG